MVTSGFDASGFDAELFERLARAEPGSFWFRARNRLIVSTLRRHFPDAASLLEIGCGTGFVLAGLRAAFPGLRLVGTELFAEGLEAARRRLPLDVELHRLDARSLPFRSEFDVAGAFDVLEHVEEDELVLRELHGAVRPGGGLILLVPQHPRLWSAADTFAHHVRRYTRRGLERAVTGAGFRVERSTSFVSALLPAMVASRVAHRVARRPYDPIAELEPGALNGLFERILDGERRLIERGVSLPVGGSLLLVARKPG
ncbi:MAG: class I SAM-dependent methyltransferase [Gaiellaceae bacterium]